MILTAVALLQVGSVPAPPLAIPVGGLQCEARTPAGDVIRFAISLPAGSVGDDIVISNLSDGAWPATAGKGKVARSAGNSIEYVFDGLSSTPIRLGIQTYPDRRDVSFLEQTSGKSGIPLALGFCADHLEKTTAVLAPAGVNPFDQSRWIKGACFFTALPPIEAHGRLSWQFRWDKDYPRLVAFSPADKAVWAEPLRAVISELTPVTQDKIVIVPGQLTPERGKTWPAGDFITIWNSKTDTASTVIMFKSFSDRLGRGYAICETPMFTSPRVRPRR